MLFKKLATKSVLIVQGNTECRYSFEDVDRIDKAVEMPSGETIGPDSFRHPSYQFLQEMPFEEEFDERDLVPALTRH